VKDAFPYPGALSADPDIAGALSFILDPQTNAENMAIATGYVSHNSLNK